MLLRLRSRPRQYRSLTQGTPRSLQGEAGRTQLGEEGQTWMHTSRTCSTRQRQGRRQRSRRLPRPQASALGKRAVPSMKVTHVDGFWVV